jgi:uncharacterized protein YjdB/alpha-tubulin suppressor-like RCC1 family protein
MNAPACARCGQPITPGARFCTRCGSDVSGEQGNVATARMPSVPVEEQGIEILRRATLGEYEVLAELGRGGMATVYLAHEISLDRKVAIKVMAPQLMFGEGMAERFRREARTAASLSHPHIIPIYAVKEAGRVLYFVMKFVAGRPLDDIIRQVGALPIPMARAILTQVGSALGYAHRRGIIHRDIKPANIMIDDEGWPVVTDFGIAKVAETQGLTMTGVAVGTPSYMSPEQCAAKEVTGRSDQYSLGIVAYEMITGKQPFVADTAMAIMWQHFNDPPRPIREHRPDCPPELEAAVLRMIEKQPDKRWSSIEDAVAAMGSTTLAHDDPIHLQMVGLAKSSLNQRLLDEMKTPTSLVPPTRASGKVKTEVIATVGSVAVSPRSANLAAGDTLQLSVMVQDTKGDTVAGREVSWTSADSRLASVSPSGLVTALAPGEVIVTGTVEKHSGTCQLVIAPVPVAAVVTSPATGSLEAGATLQLSATLRDPQGKAITGRSIAWSSSEPATANVSAQGLVAAAAPGTARITASCEGKSGTAVITVVPAAVATIDIAPPVLGLTVGRSERLTVAVKDSRGHAITGRAAAWSSRAPRVATVEASGDVTAVSAGSAEIVATLEGKSASATINVIEVQVASVQVSPNSGAIKIGEKIQLAAEPRDERGKPLAGRPVTWASSKPAVASVSGEGLVTGLGVGNAIISASVEGKKVTAEVRVAAPAPPPVVAPVEKPAPPVEKVVPPVAAVPEAATQKIEQVRVQPVRVEAEPREQRPVPATRSKLPLIAGVIALALVAFAVWRFGFAKKPVGSGSAGAGVAVAIAASPASPSLAVGDSVQMSASYRDSSNQEVEDSRPVTWTSDNPAVAVVSGHWVKAIGGGSATIIADAGGLRGTAVITVTGAQAADHVAVATLGFSRPPERIQAGENVQLNVEIKDQRGSVLAGRPVAWTSSNPAVAQVSPAGLLTARGEGTATITASSEGKSTTLSLTVAPVTVAAVSVTPSRSSIEVEGTVQLTAQARDGRGNALAERSIEWSSNNSAVATVGADGTVKGVAVGSATITASSGGKTATAGVTVVLTRIDVATVAISPNGGELEVGERMQLAAELKDARGGQVRDRTPSWASSDPAVATVSPTGQVTAINSGTATITASSDDKRATVRVTVARVPVASLVLTSPPASLPVGESFQLNVSLRDRRGNPLEDRPVIWSSSSAQVATVTTTGRVTAMGAGSARITASSENKNVSVTINVTRPVVAVVDSPRVQPPDDPGPPPSTGGTLPRGLVAAGGNLSCGLLPGGAVACWGGGVQSPTVLETGARLNRLSAGTNHVCGLTSGGEAYCWGLNSKGQVGDGTSSNTRPTPVAVAGGGSYRAIRAGGRHTCALSGGGRVTCWGENGSGQIGDGSTSNRSRPTPVPDLTFTDIAAGGSHTCGIGTDGKTYCWGDGFSGQLGYGQLSTESNPVEVDAGILKFAKIYAGGTHTCALTAAGKAYCWGDNRASQVGDGSNNDRTKPVEVATTASFEELSLGGSHTCGRTTGGAIYCWGGNGKGQLGDGSRGNRARPVRVPLEGSFTSVSAGAGHTCVASATQSMCWGDNARGQLGDGSIAARPTPAPVIGAQ